MPIIHNHACLSTSIHVGCSEGVGAAQCGLLARLAVGELGLMLCPFDEEGKVRALLAVTLGTPVLGLGGETANPRAMLAVTKDRAGVDLRDENRKLIWSTPRGRASAEACAHSRALTAVDAVNRLALLTSGSAGPRGVACVFPCPRGWKHDFSPGGYCSSWDGSGPLPDSLSPRAKVLSGDEC